MSELTHFGVPGMKWGHRKAFNASRDKAIMDARASHDTLRKNRVSALHNYDSSTTAKGKALALKHLNDADLAAWGEASKSNRLLSLQKTSAEKRVDAIIAISGTVLISGIVAVAIKTGRK